MPVPSTSVNSELKVILDEFRAPNHITPYYLAGLKNEHGHVPIETLLQVLKTCTAEELDFSTIQLNRYKDNELFSIFQSINRNLLVLNLNKTNFNLLPPQLIRDLIRQFPQTLSQLDMGGNNFKRFIPEWVHAFIKALPRKLTKLNLREFGITENLQFTDQEIIALLNELPKTLDALNFSGVSLDGFTLAQLLAICYSIPKTLNELDLSGSLNIKSASIGALFYSCPFSFLLKLGLADNRLGTLAFQEVHKVFANISRTLLTLVLRNNELHRYSHEELVRLMQQLPPGLISLDLSQNRIDVISLIKYLPQKLDTLKLSRVDIENLSPEQLLAAVKNFPATLTTLYIDEAKVPVATLKQKLLVHLIDKEMTRLDDNRNTLLNLTGITSYPFGEIAGFKKLKKILSSDPSPKSLTALQKWHNENADMFSRVNNRLAFFSSAPNKRSELLLNEIYNFIGLVPGAGVEPARSFSSEGF